MPNYSLPASQSWRTSARYLALKHLYVTTVILSLTLFVLRGLWMLADSPQLRRRWVRIAALAGCSSRNEKAPLRSGALAKNPTVAAINP
ncbi:MAG: SirB2 family protein [Candidatus Competibacter sp.]